MAGHQGAREWFSLSSEVLSSGQVTANPGADGRSLEAHPQSVMLLGRKPLLLVAAALAGRMVCGVWAMLTGLRYTIARGPRPAGGHGHP